MKQSDLMEEKFSEDIKNKIEQKFQTYAENRNAQIENMREKLREHVS